MRAHILCSFLNLAALAVTAVVDILSIYSSPICWENLWGFKIRSFVLVERRISILKRMLQIWQTSHHNINPDPHQSEANNNVQILLKVQEWKKLFPTTEDPKAKNKQAWTLALPALMSCSSPGGLQMTVRFTLHCTPFSKSCQLKKRLLWPKKKTFSSVANESWSPLCPGFTSSLKQKSHFYGWMLFHARCLLFSFPLHNGCAVSTKMPHHLIWTLTIPDQN